MFLSSLVSTIKKPAKDDLVYFLSNISAWFCKISKIVFVRVIKKLLLVFQLKASSCGSRRRRHLRWPRPPIVRVSRPKTPSTSSTIRSSVTCSKSFINVERNGWVGSIQQWSARFDSQYHCPTAPSFYDSYGKIISSDNFFL